MKLFVKGALAALLCAAGLAACGGGGGGTTNPIPVTTSTPATSASTTFSVQAFPTSVPLPAIAGFSGSLLLPGITGVGSVTVTVSTSTLVSGQAARSMHARRRHADVHALNTPLFYVKLTPANAITLRGSPGFSITVPSSDSLAGQNFYSTTAFGSGWSALGQPGTVSGSTITVGADTKAPQIVIGTGQSAYFALGGSSVASVVPALSSTLAMGTPQTAQVSVQAADALGNAFTGALATPVTIADSDTSGRTSLGGTSISDTTQSVALTYDGKGDTFTLTATSGAVSGKTNVVTTLPRETALSGSFTGSMGSIVLGNDGNFWMPGGFGFVKITPAGQVTTYANPDTTQGNGTTAIAKDSAGNLWTGYYNWNTEKQGLMRLSPGGAFASYPFTAMQNVFSVINSMIQGPDGAVWMGLGSTEYGTGTGIARIDSSGNFSNVAITSDTPVNLVSGADGNVWFSESTNIDRVTPSGALTAFPVVNAPADMNPLRFTVGPDGNFWAPWPFGAQSLDEYSTQGSRISSTPLRYNPSWDWYYSSQPGDVPFMSDIVKDRSGNIYTTDLNAQGVVRITPSDEVTAYPVYSTIIDVIQEDPIRLCIGADGKLYVFSMAEQSLTANAFVAITPIDLSDW